jgi:hypothetical protein
MASAFFTLKPTLMSPTHACFYALQLRYKPHLLPFSHTPKQGAPCSALT